MSKTVIRFEDVSKKYTLGHANLDGLRKFLPKIISRITGGENYSSQNEGDFFALKNVTFEVKQGEALGVVGPNGAGKSTILKLLAHTIEPTSGKIITDGKISALIELGAGFHHELTGRENIYLYGSIMGLKRREIYEKFDSIVAFAELEKFIDTPIKHYSSGMYARLGFAVAIHVDPDILLIDEVLAVGDMNFRKKCYEKLHEILSREHTTIIFVSHDIYRIQSLCKKTLFLSEGHIQKIGHTQEVISYYCNEMNKSMISKEQKHQEKRWGTGEVRITEVYLSDAAGKRTETFETSGNVILTLKYHSARKINNPDFRFIIQTIDGIEIICVNSGNTDHSVDCIEGDGSVRCCFESVPLLPNAYTITVGVSTMDGQIDYDFWPNAARFVITTVQGKGKYCLPAYNYSLIYWPSKIIHNPDRG